MTGVLRLEETRPTPVDSALAAAVAAGDEEAFRLLYGRHAARLRRVVQRMLGVDQADTDDTLQEAWVRAVRRIGRFRGESSLSTWLCAIAVRVSRETLRRRRRWRVLPGVALDAFAARPAPADARLDLEAAIAELPERARAIVVLHDIEGFTHAEIARHFGIAEGTSKAVLFRARRDLRQRLGGTIG